MDFTGGVELQAVNECLLHIHFWVDHKINYKRNQKKEKETDFKLNSKACQDYYLLFLPPPLPLSLIPSWAKLVAEISLVTKTSTISGITRFLYGSILSNSKSLNTGCLKKKGLVYSSYLSEIKSS